MSFNIFLIFVIIVIITILSLRIETFSPISLIYSEIDDNIAIGNPLSWSNKINPYIDINSKQPKENPVIQQAHGMPLLHEENPTIPVNHSMFYFEKYDCRPECCPFSPYSCDHGCVCWEPPEPNPNLIFQF